MGRWLRSVWRRAKIAEIVRIWLAELDVQLSVPQRGECIEKLSKRSKERSVSESERVYKNVPEGYIGFVEELPGAGRTLEETRNLQDALR